MIYIVLDTNILNVSHSKNICFESFQLNKNFEEIVKSISEDRFRDDVQILIPEIVKGELKQHRIEDYIKEIDELSRIQKNLSSLAEIKFEYKTTREYERFIERKMGEYFAKYKMVSFVPICGNEYFEKIVKKALIKETPFEGKEKTSDKGFKDTLIFYSLVNYSINNSGDYIFLTKDGKFHGNDGKLLARQFEEISGSSMYFFKDYEEAKLNILAHSHDKHIDCLEYKIVEEKYVLGETRNEILTILEYSKLKFYTNTNALKKIEHDISKIYEDNLHDWRQFDLNNYDNIEYEKYEGSVNAQVRYNKQGLLCITFLHYAYRGGAHGGAWYVSRFYDLNSGEKIKLSELLDVSEEQLLQLVKSETNKDKNRRKEENIYFEHFEVDYTSEEEIKFFLDEKGINIYFDEYEAGYYASGIIEFLLIPIEDIDCLKK